MIVLSFDGLSIAPLPAYGCDWSSAPNLDRLSIDGVTFDRFTLSTDDGVEQFRRVAVRSMPLVTDCPRVAEAAETLFDDDTPVLLLPTASDDSPPVDAIEDRHFGDLVAAALEMIDAGVVDDDLWIHSRFLACHWDAPPPPREDDTADAEMFVEEVVEDPDVAELVRQSEGVADLPDVQPPPPRRTVRPPSLSTEDVPGGDLYEWRLDYAAQVQTLDYHLGILRDAVGHRTPMTLLSTAGFSTGQNGRFGYHTGTLRSGDVHVPLIVTGSDAVAIRVPAVVDPDVVAKTIRGDDGGSSSPATWSAPVDTERWIAIDRDRAEAALISHGWFVVVERDVDGVRHERLFVKPDDWHDVNDVARLRIDVIDEALAHLP